uniref:sulfite exporter TauE/SafE family protein n=1 Tax=Thaumasiovibrio occultus TaxID=1891184 RepID=UPI000B3521F4|nr:sulfite exporter TauE/SafE family protein [Thaumasiovibrio occultus]
MLVNTVYLLTGAFGGVIIGALGSGSSLVILPVLSLILPTVLPESVSLQTAVATCMATLIVGSISGAISYGKAKLYDLTLLKWALPGVLVGALIAPKVAEFLSPTHLRLYIGGLIVAIALYKLFASRKKTDEQPKALEPVLIVVVSIVSATLSGLAGVALGILMIPFLSRYTEHRKVLGTNLMLAVPYSILGTIGYVVSGLQAGIDPVNLTLGYVYLPAFIAISLTIALFPPLGLRLVKNIGPQITQRLFYGYLLVIGVTILL